MKLAFALAGCAELPQFVPKGKNRVPVVLLFLLVPILGNAQECLNVSAGLSAKSSLAILQTASGLSIVHFESSESGDVTLNLSAGPFVSQITGGVVSGGLRKRRVKRRRES